jgi:anti-sigma factor RsiW
MMNDCSRVEVRDLLPDLLNETVSGTERALVEGHLRECAACAAELSLLRAARGVLLATPSVDVERIVRSLPAAPTAGGRSTTAGARWLRAAAAALMVGAGAAGAYALRERTADGSQPSIVARRVEQGRGAGESPSPDVMLAAGVGDLDDEALAELLVEIDALGSEEPLPSAEPAEPVAPIVVDDDA